jgi:3-oxoadipate enol-lactonase / 4-carboxymuconolactone decarboxylase
MSVPPLHVTVREPGEGAGPLLVLLPSLGTSAALWDGVVEDLVRAHPAVRILRVDFPGHGSSAPASAPFTVADLAAAVVRAVDEHGGSRFLVAGVSLGGAVALELALAHPERVDALAMIGSGARIGEPAAWRERAALVRREGTAVLVDVSAGRWFSPGYLEPHPHGLGARLLDRLREVDDDSYAHCCEALAAFDRTPDAGSVRVPALLVCGDLDPVTPPSPMRELAERIPGARFTLLSGLAHLPVVERSAETARLLGELLDPLGGER